MVCLKRLITPGLLSLEALALCVHPRHPYIGASVDAPIGMVFLSITTRDVNGYVIVCASARARARMYKYIHVLMKME